MKQTITRLFGKLTSRGKQERTSQDEGKFRKEQEESLKKVGFEQFGNTDFFLREDFGVAVEKSGHLRVFVDYYGTDKDSTLVGIEITQGEHGDDISTIAELQTGKKIRADSMFPKQTA